MTLIKYQFFFPCFHLYTQKTTLMTVKHFSTSDLYIVEGDKKMHFFSLTLEWVLISLEQFVAVHKLFFLKPDHN